jgi:L-threonylcarbamoyladenylate synthase
MERVAARRQTRLLPADAGGIAEAAHILRSGGLVAFPTETVYGLGAHALDAQAVRGIFEAKQRPANDPIIVHVYAANQISPLAVITPLMSKLAERYWPGPLTLVLHKRACVPAEVTAGLDTLAVRVPAHPIARALLVATGLPIAAPSANLFGRPSPTRGEHVLHDLDGRIDAVLDGGSATVGVESTIVAISSMPPRLLRPGGLATEDIEGVLGVRLLPPPATANGAQLAPGLLPTHYAPRTGLTLVIGPPPRARPRLLSEVSAALTSGQRVGVLAVEEDRHDIPPEARVELVGAWSDPSKTATRLFDAIRSLDAAGLDVIFARELADPSIGLGQALADRLRRAARNVVDSRD